MTEATRSLGAAGILALFLLASSPARGETLTEAADAVVEAVSAEDTDRLTELASRIEPDPWLVADELCARGAMDAAVAFARRADPPGRSDLTDYVEIRTRAVGDGPLRKALADAEDPEDVELALKRLLGFRGRGDDLAQARLHLLVGDLRRSLGRPAQAAAAYRRGAKRAADLGWRGGAVHGYLRAGLCARADFAYAAMKEDWQALLEIQRERSWDGEAIALENLGSLHGELGELREAIPYFEAARALYQEHGTVEESVSILTNLAEAHHRLGAYREAQVILERALEEAPEELSFLRARLMLQLSGTETDLGRHERALDLRRAAHGLFVKLDQRLKGADPRVRYGVASCLSTIGVSLGRVGRREDALEKLEAALEIFRAIGDSHGEAASLQNIALRHATDGRIRAAHEANQKAMAIWERVGDVWNHVHVLQNEADLHQREGRLRDAIAGHKKGIERAEPLGSSSLLAAGYASLATCWLDRDRPEEALAAARTAVQYLTETLVGLPEGQSAAAREESNKVFEVAIRAALRLGDEVMLFHVLESGRARALLEVLEGRDALRAAVIPPALLTNERQARHAVASRQAIYDRAHREGNLHAARRAREELTKARDRVQAVVENIQREAKRGAGLLYPRVDDLADARRRLRPHEALVEYVLDEPLAHALVVTRAGARIVQLGPTSAIRSVCTRWLDEPDGDDVDEAIKSLRAMIVAPLGLPDSVTRVIVTPDGPLFAIPFPALLEGVEGSIVPSATIYGVLRETQRRRGEGVLGLGDPDYTDRTGLDRLKASRAEVEAVATRRLLGAEASEGGLGLALASRPRWHAVHLACHGLVDEERPMRSGLALTRTEDSDGLLTALEVLRLELHADLVVLSACESGRGRTFRGEGLLGLARAFLFAGAPRVLVSQWKVDDEATQALMTAFYANWKGNTSASAALRRAQEAVRSHEAWAHPQYWAAWNLWGLP